MTKEISYLDAIREALAEEMRRDPKVFVLGEDVGAYGGAFGATQGLFDEFGEMRVLDTPISESAIVGISIGAALVAAVLHAGTPGPAIRRNRRTLPRGSRASRAPKSTAPSVCKSRARTSSTATFSIT